jgi:hypothetical protein
MDGAAGEGEMVAAGDPEGQPVLSGAAIPSVLAAVAAVALYAVTLGYGFVFDDASLIGPGGPRALGNAALPYRPLRYASYALDNWIGGGAAWAYHAANVVLHAATSAVVALLAIRLGATRLAAGLAGALVALHPLSVESVAYIAGRRDLLSTLFGLVAVFAWVSPHGRTVASLLAVLAAVAAKESGALFVGVLWLASSGGLGPSPARAARPLVWLALAAIVLPVAYGAIGPIAPRGAACAIANTVTALATHYVRQLVWPVHLSVEYPGLIHVDAACGTVLTASSLFGFVLLGVAVGMMVATLAGAARGKPGHALAFAAAWMAAVFVVLTTVVGIHEPGADRHAYPWLPPVAITLALAGSRIASVSRRPSTARVLVATTVAILVALTALTMRRLPSWRDAHALWTRAVVTAPESGRAHHNLAGVLLAAGDLAGAARHIRRARSLDYPPALLGDAAVACARGRYHRGLHLLARARTQGHPPADIDRIAASCEKGDSPLFPKSEKKGRRVRQGGSMNRG